MRSLIPMLTVALASAMPARAAEPTRDHVLVDTRVVVVGEGASFDELRDGPFLPSIPRDLDAYAVTSRSAGMVAREMALAGGETVVVGETAVVAEEAQPVAADAGSIRTGQPAVKVEARRDAGDGIDLVATVKGRTPFVKRWKTRLEPGRSTVVDLPVAGTKHYYVVVGGAAGA